MRLAKILHTFPGRQKFEYTLAKFESFAGASVCLMNVLTLVIGLSSPRAHNTDKRRRSEEH